MDFDSVNTAFIAWLKENGASVSPAISLQDYSADGAGRGVIALESIAKDHELFSIPRALLLSPETSELAQKIDLSKLQGWSPLILCMIYEFYRGPESKWKPYFDILPTKFSTPMFWSAEDLQELDGTGVVDKVGREESESLFKETLWPLIREHQDLFPVKEESDYLASFHNMGSLIMAYAFHNEKSEDQGPDAMDEDSDREEDEDEEDKVIVSMVPLADMLNHKTGFNNARLFHEKDCLRMVAIKKIEAGSQIFNTYGDLCNADLLRKYGFVDVPNPFDFAELSGEAVVAKCTESESAGKDEKVEWLIENDGLEDFFILEPQDDIPEEIIGCCKILLMPLEEFQSTILTGKKLPSTKMTVEVQTALRGILEEKLSQFKSTEKDDKKLLKETDGPLSLNKKNAIIVRSGERAIVQGLLDKVKKWRPPTPAPATPAGKHKTQAKGQHPNKGKKPYQKK